MSTSIDKKYNHIVKEALKNYEAAMETSSPSTRLKSAKKAIKNFYKGLEFAQYIDLSQQINEIKQYIALCYDLQGQSYFEQKNYPEAKSSFENAINVNNETTKCDKKIIRELIFRKDLLETLYITDDQMQLAHHAKLLEKLTKKTPDMEEKLSYIKLLPRYFSKVQDWKRVDALYQTLNKLCAKKGIKSKYPGTVAESYLEYGDYLIEAKQNSSEALQKYQAALSLFEESKNTEKITLLNVKIESLTKK